ncbi:MAG: PEP-CTERM sorting domain-containing protein [Planctomycetota bacterium]
MNTHRTPLVLGLVAVGMIAAAPAGADIIVNPSNTPWIADSGDVINDGTLEIAHDATAEIRPGATVTLTGAITVGQRNNPGTLSQLVASGGTFNAAALTVANKSEGDAYVELSGADVTVNNVNVGSSVAELAGVNSTLVLSDGSLDVTAGSGIMRIGATGAVNTTAPVIDWTQSGGDLTFMGKFIQIGLAPNVNAAYTMSGGTFTQTRTGGWGMVVGGDGTGTFHVDGFWDVPGVDREIDFLGGGMKVASSGTLKFSIHDANGTTLINVGGVSAANMLGTVDMNLAGYTPTMGQTFDLIKGATDYGALALAADDASAWSLGTNGDVLQATYLVPEPVTLVLLGLGAAGALRRRRR